MTGNTKVWRAPLAGLASLAMVATMGVSAMTANAATASVTLEAGTGSYADGKTSITLTDSNPATAAIEGLYANEPTRTGYTFTGWYEKDGTKAVSPLAEDLNGKTLVAHYTVDGAVTFKPAGVALPGNVKWIDKSGVEQTAPSATTKLSVPVAAGDTLADWQVPTDANPLDANSYEWWTSAQGGAKADTKNLKAGTTVYLQLTQLTNSVAVTYDTTGLLKDDFADTTTAYRATKGTKPAAPEGYYINNSGAFVLPTWTGTPAVDSNKGVENDTTFAATAGTTAAHLVTFVNYDGKGNTKVLVVADGTTVNSVKRFVAPKDTADATFDGFYADHEFLSKADLDSSVKTDFAVYAKWTPVAKDVKVTFDQNYDNSPAAVTTSYKPGDKVAKPADPTREGYVFQNWYLAGDSHKKNVFADGDLVAPDADATYLAYWLTDDDNALKTVALTRKNVKENGKLRYDADSYAASAKVYNKYFTANAVDGKKGTLKAAANKSEAVKAVQAALDKLVETNTTKLYRVYNPGNGDHYFTKDQDTQSYLVNLGWKAEGAPYKVFPSTTRILRAIPVS